MLTLRPRSARVLLSKAGRWPVVAVLAAAGALALPSSVYAQPDSAPAPAQVRDPMRPGANKDAKDAKVVVSDHMTVDLHVKDEDLSNVLELLSIQTQKNIIASKNVSGKVTATLYGVTFYQALDAILHVNGFGYMENGNFIYVYTQDELKQIQQALKKRVSKTIRLNYLNADDAKEFVTPLLSKDGGEVKINMKPADFAIPDKAPVGKNNYANSDTMVIFDYEENVKAIEELVKQIDTRPQQVLVEATILQTSLNEANAFGVDFAILGDLSFLDFANVGPLGAVNSLIRGGNGQGTQGLTPPDNKGQAIVSNVGGTAGPGGFKVGVMAGDVSIFLRMLDQVTDTVILSNPKILALNRQAARVLVGKRVGYLSSTTTDTSTTQTVEFLDTGTQLYFRPFVSSEGEIRMELKPQVSAAEIRTVTDAGGNAVTIPDELTQELVTNVNVRDGQTIVLGGLFTENTTFTRRQVPWVGDLPILGAAFRGNEDTTIRSEIIFMITPSIVTDTMIAGAAKTALDSADAVRAGTRQGLLPWSREKMTDKLNVEAEQLARDGNYDRALWNIQRSLSLNANQPEVYRLRERITGQRESWPNPSALDAVLGREAGKRFEGIQQSPTPQEHQKPKGSVVIPLEPVARGSSSSPKADPYASALETAVSASFNSSSSSTNESAPVASSSASTTTSTYSEVVNGETVTYTVASSTPNADNTQPNAVAAGTHEQAQPRVEGAGGYEPPILSKAEQERVEGVRTTLPTLRAQIGLFANMNSGQFPKLGEAGADQSGWGELMNAQVIKNVPSNEYVGGENAKKVVIGDKADTHFHSDYGWVFNPKTGELWAAGFDSSDRALDKATAIQPTPKAEPAQQQTTVPTPVSFNSDPGQLDPWSSWFGLSPSEWISMMNSDLPRTVQSPEPATASVETETNK